MSSGGGGGGGSTPANTTNVQTIREAPEIEARRLGLIDQAAKVVKDPLGLPAFEVAPISAGEQMAVTQAQQTGLGLPSVQAAEQAALKQLSDEETSFRNMVGDIYGNKEKILASVEQAADRDTQEFGQGLVSGTQILAKQMDTLNNNVRLLLDADIANSKIDAEYALEEMRKNVELAVKTAIPSLLAALLISVVSDSSFNAPDVLLIREFPSWYISRSALSPSFILSSSSASNEPKNFTPPLKV